MATYGAQYSLGLRRHGPLLMRSPPLPVPFLSAKHLMKMHKYTSWAPSARTPPSEEPPVARFLLVRMAPEVNTCKLSGTVSFKLRVEVHSRFQCVLFPCVTLCRICPSHGPRSGLQARDGSAPRCSQGHLRWQAFHEVHKNFCCLCSGVLCSRSQQIHLQAK